MHGSGPERERRHSRKIVGLIGTAMGCHFYKTPDYDQADYRMGENLCQLYLMQRFSS